MNASVLLTGGTGGLGSHPSTFLADGWRVVVPWVTERDMERAGHHDRLELVKADLFDPDAVAATVRMAAQDAGAPQGRGQPGRRVRGWRQGPRDPVEDFERQFRLNLRPAYLVTAAAVPELIAAGGGTITCVSSRAALRPFAGAAGYIASKAAVLAFVQAVAVEYAAEVRCNAVIPGVIDTPAQRAGSPDADFSKWVQPAEIAAVIRFLSTDASSPVNGAGIPVYGRA